MPYICMVLYNFKMPYIREIISAPAIIYYCWTNLKPGAWSSCLLSSCK